MIRAVLTLAGLGHLWFGSRALRRARSRVEIAYGVCIAACGVAGLLWPAPNALLFDRFVHITGAALLLRYTFLTLGFVSGFTSLSALMAPLTRWHRAALGVYGGLLTALAGAWVLARGAAMRDPARLLYGGYHGTAPSLLAFNLIAGLTVVYACALLMREITRVPHESQDRQARVAMWIIFAILGGIGVTGGLMIVGQALADRMGRGATAVALPLDVMVAGAIVTSPILNTWAFYLLPAWRHVGRLASLRQQIRSLQRLRQDMVVLLMLLSDRLVYLVEHSDPATVQAVARRCQERRLDRYRRSVAVEAARWIAFRRALLARRAWASLDAITRRAVDERIVMDAARRCRSGPRFYRDVYSVIILALGSTYVPTWLELERDAQRWHHSLAEHLMDAFGSHAPFHTTPTGALTADPPPRKRGWVPELRACVRRLSKIAAAGWSSVRPWLSTRDARSALDAIGDDLTALRALCDDLLIHLHDNADGDLIYTVAALCQERGIPLYWARVASEAARWVSFFTPSVAQGQGPCEERGLVVADEQSMAAGHDAQRVMERMRLLADTSRVVLLVLRPEQVPIGIAPSRTTAGWHSRIAQLINTALANDGLAPGAAATAMTRSSVAVGTERT